VARYLPEYRFYLIGRDTARMNRIYKGYAERILSNKPSNVEYVEARIRQVPEFLEESKIYLHTSTEPGMNIAMMEAMSAGCIPIAPRKGGAGEPIDVAGVGFRYSTVQDATQFIRSELSKNERSQPGNGASLAPQAIADKARIFSPESFQNRIQDIIEKQHAPP
jgi:glycosyltransferase involved in cell wall biosynthesis